VVGSLGRNAPKQPTKAVQEFMYWLGMEPFSSTRVSIHGLAYLALDYWEIIRSPQLAL